VRTAVPSALLCALALALTAGAARADASFSDPAGDQVGSQAAPDVTTVDVANTPAGVVTIRATVANYQELPPGTALVALLDTDKNVSTGDDGFEAAFTHGVTLDGSQVTVFERYSQFANALLEAPVQDMSSSFSAGTWTWSVARSELFQTAGFGLAIVAIAVKADGSLESADLAPDTGPLWEYDLVGVPPPPARSLNASTPSGRPAKPIAGKPFAVSSLVTQDDLVSPATSVKVTCAVKIGSARVPAVGRFRAPTTASCAMTIPPRAKGKTLRGTMTVRAAEGTVRKTFVFRVR
jgi:hypothetical protein